MQPAREIRNGGRRGAAAIAAVLLVFVMAAGFVALMGLNSNGWVRTSTSAADEALALERARAGVDLVLARIDSGEINLAARLDPAGAGAGVAVGGQVWPASGEANLPSQANATASLRKLGATSTKGSRAWPWARIEATGSVTNRRGETVQRTVALVLRPAVEGETRGIFGEFGYISRGRMIIDKSTVDAVDTREGPAGSQALGARRTKLLSFGQMIARYGAHIHGDMLTTFEQRINGDALPLDASGWLQSPRRKDAAIVLRGTPSKPVVVEGDVRATRGTIFINDYATVEGAASTNGITQSGLIPGWGFRPNVKVGNERFFDGGTVEGGIGENGPAVLGAQRAHDAFMGALVAQAQQIAIDSGAGVRLPGSDGVLGTSDDTFRMGNYQPVLTNDPASTYWNGIGSSSHSTVNRSATISMTGLVFNDGTAVKAGSAPQAVAGGVAVNLQDVGIGNGDVLTINTGNDPTKTLTVYVKSGIGLNGTARIVSQGQGKLNIISSGGFSTGNYTRVELGHTSSTGLITNLLSFNGGTYNGSPSTPGVFSTAGDLAVHTRTGSITADGNAVVTIGGNASFSTTGGEFKVVGASRMTIQGAAHVELPNMSTPGQGIGSGSLRVEGTFDVGGNFTADADNIWFKQGSVVTLRGSQNALFALRDVSFGPQSDISEGNAHAESGSEGSENSSPDSGSELNDASNENDTGGASGSDDAQVTFQGGALQIYVNLGDENRTDPVRIRNGAAFRGAIFAPFSRISIGGSQTTYVGAAVGEKLVVRQGMNLRHDLALGTIVPASGADSNVPPSYVYVGGFLEPTVVNPTVVGE